MIKSQLSFRLRQKAPQQKRKEARNKDTQKKATKTQPPQRCAHKVRLCRVVNFYFFSSNKVELNTGGLIYPAGDTAFKALLSARFCAAIWSHITDCDETYNYWEPTHYLGTKIAFFPEPNSFYLHIYACSVWQRLANVGIQSRIRITFLHLFNATCHTGLHLPQTLTTESVADVLFHTMHHGVVLCFR